MKGSTFANVGNVTIGCISPEARDLLDTIMQKWEEHMAEVRKHYKGDYEPSPYALAYWLVRWSGLIQPASSTLTIPDCAIEVSQSPKFGDTSTCRACGEAIQYIGPHWRHLTGNPRHVAEPIPESAQSIGGTKCS